MPIHFYYVQTLTSFACRSSFMDFVVVFFFLLFSVLFGRLFMWLDYVFEYITDTKFNAA